MISSQLYNGYASILYYHLIQIQLCIIYLNNLTKINKPNFNSNSQFFNLDGKFYEQLN